MPDNQGYESMKPEKLEEELEAREEQLNDGEEDRAACAMVLNNKRLNDKFKSEDVQDLVDIFSQRKPLFKGKQYSKKHTEHFKQVMDHCPVSYFKPNVAQVFLNEFAKRDKNNQLKKIVAQQEKIDQSNLDLATIVGSQVATK